MKSDARPTGSPSHGKYAIAVAVSIFLIGGLAIAVAGQRGQLSNPLNATPASRLTNAALTGGTDDDAEAVAAMMHRDHPLVTHDLEGMDLGQPHDLSMPSSMSVPAFESELFPFLDSRRYVELGWKSDKSIRDTGPWIDGSYYGTHPAVRVYYSPGLVRWLAAGRVGTIPDGEMIIKEQYPPPAVRHEGKTESEIRESLESWTVMVKDASGSHDGWFWSNPTAHPVVADNHEYPFDHPASGFGIYCVRCHAATQSPLATKPDVQNEFTFSALRNIAGFPGEPIIFRVDDSWMEDSEDTDIDPEHEEKIDETVATDEAEAAKEITAELAKYHSAKSGAHPRCTNPDAPEQCITKVDNAFLKQFPSISEQGRDAIAKIPPITHDWVVQNAGKSREFVTSNQCMSCHAGLTKPYGPSMFIPIGESADYGAPGHHVSPYGEWRWTPMGLAGRDPIFYAQLDSEKARLADEFSPEEADEISAALTDTCLRCHGAMGKHQFDADHGKNDFANRQPPQLNDANEYVSHSVADSVNDTADAADADAADKLFTLDHVHATGSNDAVTETTDGHYGALARDGISCMVCHRAQPREQPEDDDRPYLKFFLETSITGNVHFGDTNEVYGPFKDDEIKPYVMQHALGTKPKHSDYISKSQMCGTCHTVSLPAVDNPLGGEHHHHDPAGSADDDAELIAGESVELFKKFHHHIEQATYLEWLNSEYENEFDESNEKAQSCQDCHMSRGLVDLENGIDLENISTRIAAVQDSTYPDAENLTSNDNLKIAIREEGYARHNFSGLNVFLVEMFRQHDDILGVRKNDFMTGSTLDIQHTIDNFVMTARQKTADIAIETRAEKTDSGNRQRLIANITVHNKAGHRFPSGVGFRRAFLEVTASIRDEDGEVKTIWSSGRTNSLGLLVDADGKPLPEEMFEPGEDGSQRFHPHHAIIESQNQAQVYETLLHDNEGKFTTSFIHGCVTVKDNRFLPRGWSKEGPEPSALSGRYLKATWPGPVAINDPQYTDGSGSDTTQYRIAIPADTDPAEVVVEAKLYYQAIPPYFLNNLFMADPDSPAIKRLHFLCSNLDLSETSIKDWKLLIGSATTAQ